MVAFGEWMEKSRGTDGLRGYCHRGGRSMGMVFSYGSRENWADSNVF